VDTAQRHFCVSDHGVAILKRAAPVVQALHLASGKDNSSLDRVDDLVLVASLAIGGNNLNVHTARLQQG